MMMINRMKPALTITAMLLLTSTTAFASEPVPAPLELKAPAVTEQVNADGTISLEGVLEWSELEGGFYKVGEWSLMGDIDFRAYEGKKVAVRGKEFQGMSIRMVKSLVVDQIAEKGAETKGKPAQEPVVVDGVASLEGTIEYVDLEGGFYAIDGVGLIGNEALFKSLEGKRVLIRGKEFAGVSIRQVPQIEVASVMLPLTAEHTLPTSITVNGNKLPAGQDAVMVDGVLYLPLRHVVEAAGGKVEWNAKERSVTVSMPDRMASFTIGETEAEMNENHVRYLARNMIKMEKAPVIIKGRTMISADAATSILGLYEVADTDASLNLVSIK